MKNKLFNTAKLLRPKQWIKNFAVFASVIFTGQLFNSDALTKSIFAFIIFCLMSSSIYIINDIYDIKNDKLHPFKKLRPLPSGALSKKYAYYIFTVLFIASLVASLMLNTGFFILAIVYLILQFLYSAKLKHIEIIDILTLASGYILRVYSGEVATGFHISVWLVLTTIALSLFLAVGKRRAELTLLSNKVGQNIEATRKTLFHYSEKLLDVYISIFVTAAFVFYSFFTFLNNPTNMTTFPVISLDFSPFLQRKWLMLTIIPVVYGLMRYLEDIYEKHEGESPEKVFLSDFPLLMDVTIWAILVIIIIYFVS